MLGGIFRDTLRNQTIPDQLRGRLAEVELLSYSVGPAAGQIRARAVAAGHEHQVFARLRRGCLRRRGVPGAARFPGL